MNWEKIKETCPKAWALQNEYFKEYDEGSFHTRMLYDFFDENKIFIGIDAIWGAWIADWHDDFYCDIDSTKTMGSRTEAESAAADRDWETSME